MWKKLSFNELNKNNFYISAIILFPQIFVIGLMQFII